MRKATVRELHLRTSEIIRQVANGDRIVIEKRGIAVAELRPLSDQPQTTRMPDREKFLATLPRVRTDSGRMLEVDRL
jgi:antitoxin (DNA-binding transcriptional repressor) of toxin-antitoxin stability system